MPRPAADPERGALAKCTFPRKMYASASSQWFPFLISGPEGRAEKPPAKADIAHFPALSATDYAFVPRPRV